MEDKTPISEIIEKLEKNHFYEYVEKIQNSIKYASTSGEMISDIAQILWKMEKENSPAFHIIKSDSDRFFRDYHRFLF